MVSEYVLYQYFKYVPENFDFSQVHFSISGRCCNIRRIINVIVFAESGQAIGQAWLLWISRAARVIDLCQSTTLVPL